MWHAQHQQQTMVYHGLPLTKEHCQHCLQVSTKALWCGISTATRSLARIGWRALGIASKLTQAITDRLVQLLEGTICVLLMRHYLHIYIYICIYIYILHQMIIFVHIKHVHPHIRQTCLILLAVCAQSGAIDSIALLTCHECTVAISSRCNDAKTLASEVSIAASAVNLPRVTVHVVVSVPGSPLLGHQGD